jgi:hypothetical protein
MKTLLLCISTMLIAGLMIASGFFLLSRFRGGPSIIALALTDVEVVFVVTDADSREPLSGAVIEVWIDEWRDKTKESHAEKLITGKDGKARLFRKDNCCDDHIRGNRILSTEYDLTWGTVRSVSAKGYSKVTDLDLHVMPRRVTATREDPRLTQMQMDIPLRKIVAKGKEP